jgi:hypothetical protein
MFGRGWFERTIVRSRWPIVVVVGVSLAELFFLILLDAGGQLRIIHGFNLFRVCLGHILASDHYSRNWVGWSSDLEKLVPYAATIWSLLLLRRNVARQEGQIRTNPGPAVLVGLIGAALITLHYATSTSGHYLSFQDKGIIDAWRHLADDEHRLFWLALTAYRGTYLLGSPVIYFVLCSSMVLSLQEAVWTAGRASEGVLEAEAHHTQLVRHLRCACIPVLGSIVVYQLLAWTFGMGNYEPHGYKLKLQWFTYITFCAGLLVVLTKSGPLNFWKAIKADGVLSVLWKWWKERTHILNLAVLITLLFPAIGMNVSIASSWMNRAIDASAFAITEEYHRIPADARAFDLSVDHSTYQPLPMYIAMHASKGNEDIARALWLVTCRLLAMGISPDQLVEYWRSTGSATMEARVVAALRPGFPAFGQTSEGRVVLPKRIRRLLKLWVTICKEMRLPELVVRRISRGSE